MNISKKLLVLSLCVIVVAVGFAGPNSRADNHYEKTEHKTTDRQLTPYIPSLTRSGVLFVEDPGDPGFGPITKPDTIWNKVLTQVLGAGNFGWFGPITDPTANGPALDTMQQYDLVIWNTYDFWWSYMALTSTDQTNLQNYINSGGKVWLIGQDIIYSGVPLSWLTTNFHLSSAMEDYCSDAPSLNLQGLAEINGITFTANCDYQSNGYWCDALTPDAQAHHIIRDLTYAQYNSIAYPNTTPLVTSFWTVDGRNPSPWSGWVNMVTGMLQAFGVYGIEETPEKKPARNIGIKVYPSIIRNQATIIYNLPNSDCTRIQIYDKSGILVRTLIDTYKTSGSHRVNWNGRDTNGAFVSNGIYFVKLSCGNHASSCPLIVVR